VTDEETLQERVAALEAGVAEVSDRLDRVVNRDIPLLKGTVRAAVDADIDDIGELPDAG
jgi:tetrahydromethanopterin S-methyltransferase subunit G